MKGIEEALSFGEPDQLPSFGPPFMAHVPASNAAWLGPLTSADGVGAVLTTRDSVAAVTGIRTVRQANPQAAILLDADRYSGRRRGIGAEHMSVEWVNKQLRDWGLPWALTDSGYIPAGDVAALQAVLAWAAGTSQVITALPLALEWLTRDRDRLIAEITTTGRPVAVMLESATDPLATTDAVAGLIAVLRCPVPVLLLRSDTSALGALAHGAAAVSVGAVSRLRHIYPIPDDDDDDGFTPPPSAYVPALQAYYLLETKIADAIARQPDLDLWRCGCSACHGRLLSWMLDDACLKQAVFEHSLAAQAQIAAALLAAAPGRRGSQWKNMCANAQLAHDQVATDKNRTWKPPSALKAWVSATPHPQASIP